MGFPACRGYGLESADEVCMIYTGDNSDWSVGNGDASHWVRTGGGQLGGHHWESHNYQNQLSDVQGGKAPFPDRPRSPSFFFGQGKAPLPVSGTALLLFSR